MKKPIEIFNELEKGILNIIKAADIYALYVSFNIKNELPPKELIEELIKSPNVSSLTVVGDAYEEKVVKILEQEGYLKQIGQQILLATYTSLEIYLIEKFREYYKNILSDKDINFVENNLKKITFRSIEEIKNNYYEFLKIHLPSFDTDIFTTNKCNFLPKNAWDAIKLIADARNEIAHTGESKKYKIVTLTDSWYPFDFIRRWVDLFDVNFDMLVYDKRETGLIKEYKKRLTFIPT